MYTVTQKTPTTSRRVLVGDYLPVAFTHSEGISEVMAKGQEDGL